MFIKVVKTFLFILVVGLGIFLRKRFFAQVPVAGQSIDEYSYTWVGMSLFELGVPVGISGIPGYKYQIKRYVNVDNYMLSTESDPVVINYPWMDHPPLLSLITGGWAYINGARNFEDASVALIRKPVLLMSTLSVGLVFLLAWQIYGFGVGFFSGVLYATLPLVVLSGRMIQAENGLIPSFLMSAICLNLFLKNKKNLYLFLAGVFAGVATLFKIPGIFVYLYIFLVLYTRKLTKKYWIILAAGLPISFLFVIYGLAFGVDNFWNITRSNLGRFYGVGSSLLFDLFTKQRLTQHKFLPEAVLVLGWLSLFLFFIKGKIKDKISLALLGYLLVFIFAGSQPYGWYAFPIWPLLVVGFAKTVFRYKRLGLVMLLMTLGDSISRNISIFDFQKYSTWWKYGSVALLILVIFRRIKPKYSLYILYILLLLIVVGNILAFYKINPESWWNNIS